MIVMFEQTRAANTEGVGSAGLVDGRRKPGIQIMVAPTAVSISFFLYHKSNFLEIDSGHYILHCWGEIVVDLDESAHVILFSLIMLNLVFELPFVVKK